MPRFTKVQLFITAIILISILIVTTAFLLAGKKTFPVPKILKPSPSPAPIPRSVESFARPEGQKASYNSRYLKQTVIINNVPSFVSIPASFIINSNQVNGVVVKIIDKNHFILESNNTIIPTVITPQTSYLELKNIRNQFMVEPLVGDQKQMIMEKDFLTVYYQQITTSSAEMSNWQQDNNHYYQARKIQLYEKM